MDFQLQEMASRIYGLKSLFIIAMPDALLFDSWSHMPQANGDAIEISSYFGDMIRANHQGLRALSVLSDQMQITVEVDNSRLIMYELKNNFVVIAMFDHQIALGLIRLELKHLLHQLETFLPKGEIERRSKGVRIIDFLLRYAPDAHAVLQRVSLITALPMDLLKNPIEITDDQAEIIQETAKRILGLNHIDI